jgi:aconitate decarboxylase
LNRDDAIASFCAHVCGLKSHDIPDTARHAAHKFILDSLGVGVGGSVGPHADDIVEMHRAYGGATQSRVLGRTTMLPAPAAALCNAYQIHNAEYDCVHEDAVVHPMAVLLGALLAASDRACAEGRRISGREFTDAVVVGVDVAAGLGVASNAPLRFFRPATAGAFGAVAAVGRLLGFGEMQLRSAMGIVLAQVGGTMQAHVEGSAVLAMQVGFNARNAVAACDLASAGVIGPSNSLEGPFGYLTLIEGDFDVEPVLESLGTVFRIEEVAHKPFPSGRATHGIVDACLTIMKRHRLDVQNITAVKAMVPPLTQRLVGRPVGDAMGVNYARLSGPYVAAVALTHESVGRGHFMRAALADESVLALGRRISVLVDENPDPNALTPIRVDIQMQDGSEISETVETVYGNPDKPMLRPEYLAKFRGNWLASFDTLEVAAGERCIERVEALDEAEDMSTVTKLTQP